MESRIQYVQTKDGVSSAFATMREGIRFVSAAKEGAGRAQRYPRPRDTVPDDLNR
jgi:hypothetical protein